MGNTVKPDHQGQPEITGVEDQRRATTLDNGDGINGPLGKDQADNATLYGETAYGGGQQRNRPPKTDRTVHGGQQGVQHREQKDGPHDEEGHACTKATLPGAGADKGPPQSS